ncbi:flippase-like domain-containing protein [Actinocorallia sp. API 0066]|uniref:lysylphosphatidylglycerol synthase transmembrane domain-containing protein n=1 Tax=Actinocorallia sp. API 0066 TaxID=2896846 RepID=UPI001E38772C|nr:lysylphosphatidylglycerol synthase transmembrane domain-containing protein [Actinocorallia sp. API 0066]MCD0449936.1 flippase-like domain-containing protein [Actinocorallia sp. API 0066]
MTKTQGATALEPPLSLPDGAEVDEAPFPARIRSQGDLIKTLACLAGLGLLLLLPTFATQTTTGLESDVTRGTEQAPHFLLSLASLTAGFGVLAVPMAFAVDRVVRRDLTRIAVGLVAAIAALGAVVALDAWIEHASPTIIVNALGWTKTGQTPVPADLTPVIAYVTAVRLAGRPRWQAVMWGTIALAGLASLVAGHTTALGLVATYLIGRLVGYLTLYGLGTPNPRPPGAAVVAALDRLGLQPLKATRVDDGTLDHRSYLVHGRTRDLDVTVLDRDQQTAGLFYRAWRGVRLRAHQPRRTVRSLRRSLEQESLMAYAATAAGVQTPRLVATSEVGTEAALLAYTHVEGTTLLDLPDEEITDDLLKGIWLQLGLLHRQRIAHRSLDGSAVLVCEGRPWLVGLGRGEIAVGDLLLRLDQAQLLTTLGLRVGAGRAVHTASAMLGADALGALVPLLQKVALSRETRAALRKDGKLLGALREEILRFYPETEVATVKLERFRPRTIFSIVGAAIAAYFLLTTLGGQDLGKLVTEADWRWAVLALFASGVSFVAAAMMVIGFVPERLPMWRTVAVQFAASFVKLVAPAAVSGIAINTRYLQRMGVRPGPAVASVGASQLTGLVVHIMLLFVMGFLTGSGQPDRDFAPSKTVMLVLLAVGAVAGLGAAVGPVRRLVVRRLKLMFSGVVPRLVDVLQDPRKIVTGLGGTLLLTVAFVVCLDASIRAFGGSLGWTAVAVVFLTGNALGSAAPTPGGLGAVEGALVLGLTVAGLPVETATSAVLLFRLLTFWLPVLPGWASFHYLQRTESL